MRRGRLGDAKGLNAARPDDLAEISLTGDAKGAGRRPRFAFGKALDRPLLRPRRPVAQSQRASSECSSRPLAGGYREVRSGSARRSSGERRRIRFRCSGRAEKSEGWNCRGIPLRRPIRPTSCFSCSTPVTASCRRSTRVTASLACCGTHARLPRRGSKNSTDRPQTWPRQRAAGDRTAVRTAAKRAYDSKRWSRNPRKTNQPSSTSAAAMRSVVVTLLTGSVSRVLTEARCCTTVSRRQATVGSCAAGRSLTVPLLLYVPVPAGATVAVGAAARRIPRTSDSSSA